MIPFILKIPDRHRILQFKELIMNLPVADLTIRYHISKLGFLWSLLNPLFMTAIYLLVFTSIMKFRTKNYSMFLLLGIILWRFFAEGTSTALKILKRNGQLIRKIYFPREFLVIGSVTSSFFSVILELCAFFIIFLFFGSKIHLSLLILPVLLFAELILVLGVSLLISTIYVFFRDYDDIWGLTIKAGFYLTPILWPLTVLGEDSVYLPYILINPMARIVISGRMLVLDGVVPSAESFFILFVTCGFIFLLGYITFKKYEPRLAREV